MKKGPDHYRYVAKLEEYGVVIRRLRYVVAAETKLCYWIIPCSEEWLLERIGSISWRDDRIKRVRKLVSKTSRKRYAYPDDAQALESFRARLRWREHRAEQSLSIARLAIAGVSKIAGADSLPVNCGHDEVTERVEWE